MLPVAVVRRIGLVDRPEVETRYVRVTGAFTVEATIPAPVDWEGDGVEDSGAPAAEAHESCPNLLRFGASAPSA